MATQHRSDRGGFIARFKHEILPTAFFVVVLASMIAFSDIVDNPLRKTLGVFLIAGFQVRLCWAYYSVAVLLKNGCRDT